MTDTDIHDPVLIDCLLESCPTKEISKRVQFSERNRCVLATQGTFLAKSFYRAKYHFSEYLTARESMMASAGTAAARDRSASYFPTPGSDSATSSQNQKIHKRRRRLAMMDNQRVKFKICVIGYGSIGSLLVESLLTEGIFSPRDIIVVTRRKDGHLEHSTRNSVLNGGSSSKDGEKPMMHHHPDTARTTTSSASHWHNSLSTQLQQVTFTQNLKWALRQCDLVFICVLPSQFQYLDFNLQNSGDAAKNKKQFDASLNLMENLLKRKVPKKPSTSDESTSGSSGKSTSGNSMGTVSNRVFVSFLSGVPRQKVSNSVHSNLVITLQLSSNQKFKTQFSQLTNFRKSLKQAQQNGLFVRFTSPHDSLDEYTDSQGTTTTHPSSLRNLWLKEQFYPVMASYIQQQSISGTKHTDIKIHNQHLVAMAIDHSIGMHIRTEVIEEVWQKYLSKNVKREGSTKRFWTRGDFFEDCLEVEMQRQRELEAKKKEALEKRRKKHPSDMFSLQNFKSDSPLRENLSPLSDLDAFLSKKMLKFYQEMVYIQSV